MRLSSDLLCVLDQGSQVTCLSLGPDKSQLVAGTRGGSVILWCLSAHEIIQELPRHKRSLKKKTEARSVNINEFMLTVHARRQVSSVKFSPDATRVASVGSDFYMKVIDLKTGSIIFSKGLNSARKCRVIFF